MSEAFDIDEAKTRLSSLVARAVAGRWIKQGDAARMLGPSVRQVKRLVGAFRQDGQRA